MATVEHVSKSDINSQWKNGNEAECNGKKGWGPRKGFTIQKVDLE